MTTDHEPPAVAANPAPTFDLDTEMNAFFNATKDGDEDGGQIAQDAIYEAFASLRESLAGVGREPMQPVVMVDGMPRFRKNAIVAYLLDAGPFNMNTLARMPGRSEVYGGAFTPQDWQQFAQLIGYSVSGYGELSYASDESYDRASELASNLPATPPESPAVQSPGSPVTSQIATPHPSETAK